MAQATGERPNFLEAVQAALARGAWQEAMELFDASLEASESAEAHEGRGTAAWTLVSPDGWFPQR